MTLSRRLFMRGAAMAPMLARGAKEQAEKLVGIYPGLEGRGFPEPPDDDDFSGGRGSLKRETNIFNFVKQFGIPQWKLDQIKTEAKDIRRLDVDLVAMQSISLVAKLSIQADRNEKKAIAAQTTWPSEMIERTHWLKKFDISWW